MADTITTNFHWVKPEPHASPLDWGIKINADLDLIDAKVYVLDQGGNSANQFVLNKTSGTTANPIIGQFNAINRWSIHIGDGTPESTGNAGTNFVVWRYADSGALIDAAFNISRASGSATFLHPLICSSTFGCKDSATVTASTTSTNPTVYFYNSASALKGFIGWMQSTDQLVWQRPSGAFLALDSANQFIFNGSGNAYKAGGGVWATLSDARVKTVINDYDAGLPEILQLRPVVYRYNGNDGEAHKQVAEEHRSFVGLVAQEVEGVMPELVSYGRGTIDGEEVADLRTLDSTALVYALCNAVKELKAEIEELKKR